MPKTLGKKPGPNAEYRYALDLSDRDDEVSIDCTGFTYGNVQIVLRGSATIGNVTIKVQYSNDAVNSSAFATPVTFTASGITTAPFPIYGTHLHVLNSASAISTGTGYADVFVKLHRQGV